MGFKRKRRKGQFERATRPRSHGDKRPVIRRRSKAWVLKNEGAADPEAMFELYRRTRDDIWLVKLYKLAFRFGEAVIPKVGRSQLGGPQFAYGT